MSNDQVQTQSRIRTAVADDVSRIKQIDALSSRPADPEREGSSPLEIEDGVSGNRTLVIDVDGCVAGFLQYERPSPQHVYIGALAVHPNSRNRGLAGALLDEFLASLQREGVHASSSISTVSGPTNYIMLRLLFSRGFIVRTIMEDYFGPGIHRFYCQYKSRIEYVDPDESYIVLASAWKHVTSLLSSGNYAITSLVALPAGRAYELSKFERDDFADLQSGETQVGVSFSGSILSAITFVLGFSFASTKYPDEVRVLLISAAVITTGSLIVYANASGELARLRVNTFSNYMKWGNVLSEFGGVYPFIISLPVTFANVTTDTWMPYVVSGIVASALYTYEHSRYAISNRFRQSILTRTASLVICASPILGVFAINWLLAGWIWAAVTVGCLTGQAAIYLGRRPAESIDDLAARRWQRRH
jgi:ribosomal protein S18 acetylase RimI-like enzyme